MGRYDIICFGFKANFATWVWGFGLCTNPMFTKFTESFKTFIFFHSNDTKKSLNFWLVPDHSNNHIDII